MAFERWARHIESFLSQADFGEVQRQEKESLGFF
jgi:hypothetical protein